MGYLKFTMKHPLIFLSILFFIFLFPVCFLMILYMFNLSYSISLILSLIFVTVFICSIIMSFILKNKSNKSREFIKNISSVIINTNNFSNSVQTNDFSELRILYFENIERYDAKKRIMLHYMLHGPKLGTALAINDKLLEKGSDFYKKSVENNFSFNFNVPKSKVKIDVPKFNYMDSMNHFSKEFNEWKNNYPSLLGIYNHLPKWINMLDIFYQDDTVFVSVFADKDFCLNNSLNVYNELVELKKKIV